MRVFDLGGQWQVAQLGKNNPIPANVPGCIHTDLLAAKRIDDPYYRDNELKLQWIGETDWVFSRSFNVDAALLDHEHVLLRCDGLDTMATISINNREIAKTDNMFRTWEFDVKEYLVAGENTIVVHFASTVPYIAQRQQERYLHGWGGPQEIKGRSWVRKEPCNYGWDWGPVLTTCGIWRPIQLVAYSTARLQDVQILQDHSVTGQVKLNVNVAADNADNARLTAKIAVSLNGTTVADSTVHFTGKTADAQLVVTDPQLWWPNGMGSQPLYDVRVELLSDTGETLDTDAKRIGLRTLVLDRHPDEWGESFQFAVNGVPFFAKGANWIPADSFATRLTRDDYARLIKDAAAANMNMLRAWGGGIYEDDAFFEICDENGICVWQDFIFACATYPTFDEAFITNISAEFRDNIKRLRHHPCIALWCGNNELEQGLVGEGWTDTQMSWEDYSKLFDNILPQIVHELDPERSYWPGSPHTPIGDRYNHRDPTCGDAHLWDVWHGRQPFEWYRTCEHRFNSEFGFQSFPEPRTVRTYTAPQDRNVTTFVMEHHQRSGIGNAVIMQYMLDWFRLPNSFDMTLWLSQILQGMAMKYAVEHWRRAMPRGMGTLYWQLNDCWPVASWSSIDSFGRWKALNYMAKQFYAPLLVSGVEDLTNGSVELHVTSDLLAATNGTVSWKLTTVHGDTIAEDAMTVDIPAHTSTMVSRIDLKRFIDENGPRALMLWLDLSVDGSSVSTNFVSFARPKHIELQDPAFNSTVEQSEDGAFNVTITAASPALWTWLGLGEIEATYSQNFFHVIPGKPVQILIKPAESLTLEEFTKQLSIHSLIDTYQTAEAPVALA
ncbi:MAG TPA: glycoside hydrolase family 2 protein [Armatimonadota bacterium]|nr:glycoside hydrolase family 2 protein [Armatimonadota bacterium]